MIRKIRHIIKLTKKPTIIYTDHEAILGLIKQSSLILSSSVRQNLRLIRASEYIQRFNFSIRYKPGREHLVLNALLRLSITILLVKD